MYNNKCKKVLIGILILIMTKLTTVLEHLSHSSHHHFYFRSPLLNILLSHQIENKYFTPLVRDRKYC